MLAHLKQVYRCTWLSKPCIMVVCSHVFDPRYLEIRYFWCEWIFLIQWVYLPPRLWIFQAFFSFIQNIVFSFFVTWRRSFFSYFLFLRSNSLYEQVIVSEQTLNVIVGSETFWPWHLPWQCTFSSFYNFLISTSLFCFSDSFSTLFVIILGLTRLADVYFQLFTRVEMLITRPACLKSQLKLGHKKS